MYGVHETNPLFSGHEYHREYVKVRNVYWDEPGLKVTRLRLLSDPGYPLWDVSYCHGYIGDELVSVGLPFSELPKKNMMGVIIAHAKRDRVYAKGIGVFNAISTLC